MIDLYFSATPDPNRAPDGCRVVSLDIGFYPISSVNYASSVERFIFDRHSTDEGYHRELRESVDAVITEVQADSATRPSSLQCSYVYSILFTPIVAWQSLIRTAIRTYAPSRVFIPRDTAQGIISIGTREELLRACFFRVLAEETNHLNTIFYSEEITAFHQLNSGWLPPRSLDDMADQFSQAIRRIDQGIWKIRSLTALYLLKFVHLQRKMTQRKSSTESNQYGDQELGGLARVLIIGQARQISRLTDFTRGHEEFTVTSISEAANLGPTLIDSLRSPIVLSSGDSAMFIARRFATQIALEINSDIPALKKLAESRYELFITDSEHDPRARILGDLLISMGKTVVLVPEGATYTNGAMWPYMDYWYYKRTEAIRCAVGTADQNQIGKKDFVDKVIVTGYLGATDTGSFLEQVPFRLLHYFRKWRAPDRRTALLAIDGNKADIGVTVPGYLWPQSYARAYDEMVRELNAAGFHVIVRLRDARLIADFRTLWADCDVSFSVYSHWGALLPVVDVVISEQSSVAIQSLRLGKRVIVKRFSTLPAFSDAYSSSGINGVTLVRLDEDLKSGIVESVAVTPGDGFSFDTYLVADNFIDFNEWFSSFGIDLGVTR